MYHLTHLLVQQNAHVAPGLGIRNRAQRLAEYAQRRADVLGLSPPPSPPLFDVTNTPKRRRLNVDFTEMKKAGSSEMTAIAEEAKKMQAMTISFGIPDRGKSNTGIGYVSSQRASHSLTDFWCIYAGSNTTHKWFRARSSLTFTKGRSSPHRQPSVERLLKPWRMSTWKWIPLTTYGRASSSKARRRLSSSPGTCTKGKSDTPSPCSAHPL